MGYRGPGAPKRVQDLGGRAGLRRNSGARQVWDLGGREGLRSTSSTEPTLWSSVKRSSTRAPRDPWAGPVRHARHRLRRSAGARSDEAYGELGRSDVRMMDAPPKGYRDRGEWDWYRHLHPEEQARLRRSWFRPRSHPGYGVSGPDNVADRLAAHNGRKVVGGSDQDEEVARWLELTRVADGGRAMSRGRLPKPNAHGNIALRNLVGDEEEMDPARVFERDPAAARAYVAQHHAELEDEYAYRAERDARAELERVAPPAWADEDF